MCVPTCILSLNVMVCRFYCTSPSFCCLTYFCQQLSHCWKNPCSPSAFFQDHKVRSPYSPVFLSFVSMLLLLHISIFYWFYCQTHLHSMNFYISILALHETEVFMAVNGSLTVFVGVVLCGLASGFCQFEGACQCMQNRSVSWAWGQQVAPQH